MRHGSHLTAPYAREWSRAQFDRRKSAELGLVSVKGLQNLDQYIEGSIDAMTGRLRSTLDDLTRRRELKAELLCIDGVAADVVPQYARYGDLHILGGDAPERPASVGYTFSEQPIRDRTPSPVRSVRKIIHNAWPPYCRGLEFEQPAARSLNPALPLIECADRTTILMVNPSGFIDTNEGPQGEQMVEHLRRHGATIMGRPPEAVEMESALMGDHPHVIIAAPNHPLAKRRSIWPRGIAGVTILMREVGSGTRTLVERFLATHDIRPRIGMEIGSNETIKQAVMAGLGIAFISAHTIAGEIADGRLAVLDIAGLPEIRQWFVVRPMAKRMTPAAQALRDFLVAEGRHFLPKVENRREGCVSETLTTQASHAARKKRRR